MKKQFKADSKKILNLVINSIYSNQEIFLRELVANASDALDKYHFAALTNGWNTENLKINIDINTDERKIIISDNGIGMNQDELDQNLGTIAESGTLRFKEINKENNPAIGQFGIGFYSAFIVAKKVAVITKKAGEEQAYLFTSDGENDYEIMPTNREEHGTSVEIYLKDDVDEQNYSSFLETHTIKEIIGKYSDYIRYPIKMMMPKVENEEESKEAKEVLEEQTLNSMIPLWQRKADEIKDEDKNRFYMEKFNAIFPPFFTGNISVEGVVSYQAMYFIPELNMMQQLNQGVKYGFQLYCKGMLVLEKEDFLPRYLSYLSGVIDTPDLQLNVSRELIQQSAHLKRIASNVEKRILKDLLQLQTDDKERYLKFYKMYHRALKAPLTDVMFSNKEAVCDLLLFNTVNQDQLINFKQYIEKMKEGQKEIYFVYHKNKDVAKKMPQVIELCEQGHDVILLDEDVDEVVFFHIRKYQDFELKSVRKMNETNKDADKVEQLRKDNEVILNRLKELLKDDVVEVTFSDALGQMPLSLRSNDEFSLSIEEYIKKNHNDYNVPKTLLLNPEHRLFKVLEATFATGDEELFNDLAFLLVQQGRLQEGLSIEKPNELADKMLALMLKVGAK